MKKYEILLALIPILFFSCSGNGNFIPMNPKGPHYTSSVLQTLDDYELVGDIKELKEYTNNPKYYDLIKFDEFGNVTEKSEGDEVKFRAYILDGIIVGTTDFRYNSSYFNEVDNEDGEIKQIRRFSDDKKIGFTNYVYRPDGQLDYEANFTVEKGIYEKQSGLARYQYDNNGRVVSKELGYYSSQKNLYTYKGNSEVVDSVFYKGGSELTRYSVNKYRNGNLVEKTTYSSRDDTSGEVEVFEYDKYGNLVRSYLDNGRVRENLKRVKYEYDNEKNWTKKEVFIDGKLDSSKTRIITYRRYKYLF